MSGYGATAAAALPNDTELFTMAALLGASLLSVFELAVLIMATFRHRSGLYFWSVTIAAFGALVFNLGLLLLFFVLKYRTPWLSAIFIATGYIIHVPAEFAVLYSRLHLIGASQRTLHLVLVGIVVEVSLIALPSCILVTGALATTTPKFALAFFYFQRLEVCVYAAFEIVLSGVYIYHVRLMWDVDGIEARKSVLERLLYMSILIICLDLSNLTVEFAGKNAVRSSLVVCPTFIFAFFGMSAKLSR